MIRSLKSIRELWGASTSTDRGLQFAQNLPKLFRIFCEHSCLQLGRRLRHGRKIVTVLIWFAGINHNSGVVVLLIEGQWINFAAPALSHHLEIVLGIASRSHGPHDFGEIRR